MIKRFSEWRTSRARRSGLTTGIPAPILVVPIEIGNETVVLNRLQFGGAQSATQISLSTRIGVREVLCVLDQLLKQSKAVIMVRESRGQTDPRRFVYAAVSLT